MDHQPVSSSLIKSVGYDAATETLEVNFHRGYSYEYENVPEAIFVEFVNAPSIGIFFGLCIKSVYKGNRLA
jgi:hypothetical protein